MVCLFTNQFCGNICIGEMMKKDRYYLVTDGRGDIFALTPNEIAKDNDKGAGFRLIMIDEEGRAYLDERGEPKYEDLFKETWVE